MNYLSILEWGGALLAIASLILVGRKRIIGWPVGVSGSSLLLAFFATQHLWSQCLMSAVYIVCGLSGWWKWVEAEHKAYYAAFGGSE